LPSSPATWPSDAGAIVVRESCTPLLKRVEVQHRTDKSRRAPFSNPICPIRLLAAKLQTYFIETKVVVQSAILPLRYPA
jgi:hypothetical protein